MDGAQGGLRPFSRMPRAAPHLKGRHEGPHGEGLAVKKAGEALNGTIAGSGLYPEPAK